MQYGTFGSLTQKEPFIWDVSQKELSTPSFWEYNLGVTGP
jgi:hypothetical protein